MREYLYRGKRKDNGKWVYGSLISLTQGEFIVTTDHYNTVNIDLHEKLLCNALWEDNDFVEVFPNTICEFTGLTDKNGNKIFEGDIIKVVTEDTHEERFIEVGIGEFTDDGSGDLFIGAYLKYDGFTVSAGQIKEYGSNGVEIIGNIHDNPEILEK